MLERHTRAPPKSLIRSGGLWIFFLPRLEGMKGWAGMVSGGREVLFNHNTRNECIREETKEKKKKVRTGRGEKERNIQVCVDEFWSVKKSLDLEI